MPPEFELSRTFARHLGGNGQRGLVGEVSRGEEFDAQRQTVCARNSNSSAGDIRDVERSRSCEICGGSQSTQDTHYTVSEWPVVSCDDCGFVFLGRVPDYEQLNGDYDWATSFKAEEDRRTSNLWGAFDMATRVRTTIGKLIDNAGLRSSIGNTGRVLEIGCGYTTRIPSGATPYGIEISEALVQRAISVFSARGGKVIHAPAVSGLAQFPDGFFDAVLMRSYLEHEPQAHLVLKQTRRTLKHGGVVYVRVPNFGSLNRRVMGTKWCGFRFPDHVNYFTPRDLKRLAETCGFTCRHINWFSPCDDNFTAELRADH